VSPAKLLPVRALMEPAVLLTRRSVPLSVAPVKSLLVMLAAPAFSREMPVVLS
jgi:hypothetical protein